jgi:hypothetical protein
MSERLKGLCAVVIFTLFFVGIIFTIVRIEQLLIKQACPVFSEATNRETKFIRYNILMADCLAKLDNGKWVIVNNLNSAEK